MKAVHLSGCCAIATIYHDLLEGYSLHESSDEELFELVMPTKVILTWYIGRINFSTRAIILITKMAKRYGIDQSLIRKVPWASTYGFIVV